MNTPRSVGQQVSAKGGWVCVTRARTSQRRTALIVAVTGDNMACVEALIAAKAALDIQDEDNKTALDRAKEEGHRRIVDILVKAGAKQ